MNPFEFQGFPKTFRLNRDIVVTEKIDGTNGQIFIVDAGNPEYEFVDLIQHAMQEANAIPVSVHGDLMVFAGSKNRWLTTDDDNFGFAGWVQRNSEQLLLLGPGRHFGEWWGKGIQRGYNQLEKRFSLFNTERWGDNHVRPPCCDVVPVLYRGAFLQGRIGDALDRLRFCGSLAAPRFMTPEGIVVFHTAANRCFKVTLENDDKPKGLVE